MYKDLELLTRLHEIYEAKLLLVSDDYDCSAPRNGYEHEYSETNATLNLLDRLIKEKG